MHKEIFLIAIIDFILLKIYKCTKNIRGVTSIYEKIDVHNEPYIVISIHEEQTYLVKNQIIDIILPKIYCNSYPKFVDIYNKALRQKYSKEIYERYKVEL